MSLNIRLTLNGLRNICMENYTLLIGSNRIPVSDTDSLYRKVLENVDKTTQKAFTNYVTREYGSEREFNKYIFSNRTQNLSNYRFVIVPRNGLTVYYQHSQINKELTYIGNVKSKSFIADMVYFMKHELADPYFRSLSSQKAAREIESSILYNQDFIRNINIKPLSNNPDEYCLTYINLDEMRGNANAPTPAWDSFINQFQIEEEREAFMSFAYSIFNVKDKCRQVLWVKTPGYGGKSAVARVIGKNLDPKGKKIVETLPEGHYQDKYSSAKFEHSRLVLIPDNKERAIIRNAWLKQLTGNDVVTIRAMFEEERSIEIYSKVIIMSNFSPIVNLEQRHEVTRILYLSVDNLPNGYKEWQDKYPDVNWEEKLHTEFRDFFAKCELVYKKNVDGDGNFPISENMMYKLARDSESTYHGWAKMFVSSMILPRPGNKILLEEIEKKFSFFIDNKFSGLSRRARDILRNFLSEEFDTSVIESEAGTFTVVNNICFHPDVDKLKKFDIAKKIIDDALQAV